MNKLTAKHISEQKQQKDSQNKAHKRSEEKCVVLFCYIVLYQQYLHISTTFHVVCCPT